MPFISKRKFEYEQRQRQEAWGRALLLPDCFERRVLFNLALPHFSPPAIRHSRMSVEYLPSIDEYYIYTAYARTIVKSIHDVDFFLKKEAEEPGHLEEYLTNRNSRKELENIQREARSRYVPEKSLLCLEDL
jgi:hypothetical protein